MVINMKCNIPRPHFCSVEDCASVVMESLVVEDGKVECVSGHLGFLQKDVVHSCSAILQKGIQLVFKVYHK